MPIHAAFIVPHPPLIIPQIGRGEEQKIQNTIDAYEKIGQRIAEIKPQTIIVISPHSIMYSDYIHISPGSEGRGDMGRFNAEDVEIKKKYDSSFVSALCKASKRNNISAGTSGEKDAAIDHGVLVPLYFVEKYYTDYELVRISISGLSPLEHYRFGQCIAQAAELLNRNIVIIASGDLSHKLEKDGPYGFAEEGPVFDRQITKAMAAGNFMDFLEFEESFAEAAAECGLRSFIEMAGALDGLTVSPAFLSYEGPFGVGYAACIFEAGGSDETRHFGDRFENQQKKKIEEMRDNQDEYVRLARKSLETYIKTGQELVRPDELSDELLHKEAGVFVSIKKNGQLRGCIGTIAPVESCIADEIIRNAVSAGTQDPRFGAITEDELNSLVYSVDVLGESEPIQSMDQLDAKRYGVIVTNGRRRGLLLPNLDGVDTPMQQVNIALQKAGISTHETYSMERFEVVRHK
jgi:AmmeMemoRadiSam system protein A/AmmeMemoRadiSam system protein B